MPDINLLRREKGGNPELVKESQRRRFKPESLVDEAIILDQKWRAAQFTFEKKKASMKNLGRPEDPHKVASLRSLAYWLWKWLWKLCPQHWHFNDLKSHKEELKTLELAADNLRQERDLKVGSLGNLVHDSVPVSNDEEENVVVREWGSKREEDGLLNHFSLSNKLGIVDYKRGVSVAGNRGYFLMGDGVSLAIALASCALRFLEDRGYTKMQTPHLIEKDVMKKCAQLSQFDEELYEIAGENKYLIATSEQSLCGFFAGTETKPADLPIRYAGFSTCFRKEAGSHGRDTLGLFRVHEFQKVEQFCMTSPEKSWDMFEEMITNSEDFYKELGIPYRVVNIVSGALNDAAAKKYDLEGWFPASKKYRELVSCSNCTDYQTRKLNIKSGKKFPHMLNSTLTAIQRTVCCLLENYQTPDGINVPKVLQPYMEGRTFLPFAGIAFKQQAAPQMLDMPNNREQKKFDGYMVRMLLELVEKPNEQQRKMIVDALVSLAENIGGDLTKTELLPTCRLPIAEEQRILQDECCAKLEATL